MGHSALNQLPVTVKTIGVNGFQGGVNFRRKSDRWPGCLEEARTASVSSHHEC